eukprot:CAMPEP_0171681104 /NCGR_PEP_ID=MMETSP0990-20121206/57189_1 /TAXON_ID=483369 /ORGANISM="non described non described, Strain CCMP2098" /LENGTH=89 /DNA_ID=CAMNT_0012268127 /DNA_START=476 /DNA_END=745 /DNA_ORIENTATION=+
MNVHCVGGLHGLSVFFGSSTHPPPSLSANENACAAPVNAWALEAGNAKVTPRFTLHLAQWSSTKCKPDESTPVFRFAALKSPWNDDSVN